MLWQRPTKVGPSHWYYASRAISPLGAGGITGWESVAGLSRHCLPYLISLKSAWALRVCQWSVGAKQVCDGPRPAQSCREGWQWMVAGLAVAVGPLWGGQLTAEQVPLIISAWMMAGTVELGTIGTNWQHWPNGICGIYGIDGIGLLLNQAAADQFPEAPSSCPDIIQGIVGTLEATSKEEFVKLREFRPLVFGIGMNFCGKGQLTQIRSALHCAVAWPVENIITHSATQHICRNYVGIEPEIVGDV